ncbi:YqbF domain-containing protein [Bacillus paranthracis]|uniref:YqbF domain-containing protein n=1 Tax=Bacillus paranthracis TaxID=2026186 RepID=UPI003D65A78C
MNYYVKLIVGKTYDVHERLFLLGQEEKVPKKTYDYLNGNEQFVTRKEGSKSKGEE